MYSLNKKHFFYLIIISISSVKSIAQERIPNDWQYIQIDSTKQMWGNWAEPEWLRYFGLDAGDVNNDGNLDIISGRYVYLNPAGDMTATWERVVLDDNVDGFLIFNVDDDLYADIIAMALPNLYWYEAINAEGTVFGKRLIGQIPVTSHINSQGFKKAQIIEGGKEEIIMAGNGDIYVVSIRNNGSNTPQWHISLIGENTSDEGIGIGDIDGDGDLDIAAGRRINNESEPTQLIWFENPGHLNAAWKSKIVGESIYAIDRIEIADLDGDKKADIVVTEERYPGLEPDAHIWTFIQDVNKTWIRKKIAQQFSTNNLDIADVDKDGDYDLLTAEHKGSGLELQLWRNNGAGNFEKQIIDTGKENHLGTRFYDLDSDGDLDIIGSGWDHENYMHIWRNDAIQSLKENSVFKEYKWIPDMVSDAGKFLRVGGKLDYSKNKKHFPKKYHKKGFIALKRSIDLKNAISAEVIVERVQSHEDTKDLTIQFNGYPAIALNEPILINKPATNYMFHANIKAQVPLSYLTGDNKNTFKFQVSEEQSWDWPQNLIYGVVLKIYYKLPTPKKMLPSFEILTNKSDSSHNITLSLSARNLENIVSVDYVGLYEDVNIQGDGKYRQWQYNYHRTQLNGHIGSSNQPPFQVNWNTDWLPNQAHPITITALAKDTDGYIHVLPYVSNINRQNNKTVSLIKPYNQPPFWTTRTNEHSQYLDIPFELKPNDSIKLYWNSWSPCYSEGLKINHSILKPNSETPCYDAYWQEIIVNDVSIFKQGVNTVSTLKTPLQLGSMVHGMDVQWPGIMMKVKQDKPKEETPIIYETTYENREHYVIKTKHITYYYDLKGGGFSRIIDNQGNDWVSYRTEPWGIYPESAASSFRGLPNLVYQSKVDSGAGHPGHDQCTSKIIAPNKIRTETLSGMWQWEWEFFEDYTVLDIIKTHDETPYWFLYEGTPGGRFKTADYSFGTDSIVKSTEIPDFYKGTTLYGNFNWAYFNKKTVPNTFFLAQVNKDNNIDMISYLGNSSAGANSKDGMTVFGFGRDKGSKPLLTGRNTFIIGIKGFMIDNETDYNKLRDSINELINLN